MSAEKLKGRMYGDTRFAGHGIGCNHKLRGSSLEDLWN